MSKKQFDARQVGYYYSLAQVGLEMVFPAGIGLWIDSTWGTLPWGVITGAILGLVLGMIHMVALLNQNHKKKSSESEQEKP